MTRLSPRVVATALALAGAVGCHDRAAAPTGPRDPVATIEIVSPGDSVPSDDVLRLSVAARDARGVLVPGAVVRWSSLDPAIAAVDDSGVVRFLASGTVRLAAAAGPAADTLELTGLPRVALRTISVGPHHACGLSPAGAAYCWGRNDFGQLGNGRRAGMPWPTPAAEGLTLASITVGWYHTCALTREGAAYCWGNNRVGALGDGTTVDSPTPVRVLGGLVWTSLEASGDYTCGIAVGGDAYCWGNGKYGERGDGTQTPIATAPVPVGGSVRFARLGAYQDGTCGIAIDGAGYCWGVNAGRFATGASTNVVTTPTPISGGIRFRTIDLGSSHACGVDASDSTVYCWGSSSFDSLGLTTGTVSTVPRSVRNGPKLVALSAGAFTRCGLTAARVAMCWGYNGVGLLGDGTFVSRGTPQPVVGSLAFREISVGGNSACGVTVDDAAYCWGSEGGYGELGVGPYARSPLPIRLSFARR